MRFLVKMTSPFGRSGDEIDVDPENPRVARYAERGLLEQIDDDDSEQRQRQQRQPVEEQQPDPAPEEEPEEEVTRLSIIADPFDPSEHTVLEVEEYLEGVDDQERARVIEVERIGRARKGILSWD